MFRFLMPILFAATLISSAAAAEHPVAANAKETKPLMTGDTLPDVSLKDAAGKSVKLDAYYSDGPVVIVFFRGNWCPYCNRHVRQLNQIYPEVTKLGAKMIAISPDTVKNSKGNSIKLKAPFPFLSDSDLVAAKAFGLAFQVDDATIEKYEGFGIDLEKASGRDHHALPVPAVYIVDQSGEIVFAHSNPDYTKRLDPQTILVELKKIH